MGCLLKRVRMHGMTYQLVVCRWKIENLRIMLVQRAAAVRMALHVGFPFLLLFGMSWHCMFPCLPSAIKWDSRNRVYPCYVYVR